MEIDPVIPPDAAGPVSLRVSVTDRCPYRCLYCMPAGGLPLFTHADILRYEEIGRVVRALKDLVGLTKVHVTGGEPLARRNVVDLVAMLAAEGVEDLAMTTNGALLAEMAAGLKAAGLHRINVSLDSLNAETFRRITRGGELAQTLAGIEAAAACGLAPVKLNATLLRGINDAEVVALTKFAIGRGMTMRFIELMPIGEADAMSDEWFVPSQETLDRLGEEFTVTPLPRRPGSSSTEYRLAAATGETGVVGLISPTSRPFCGDCRRLRLTATGELIGCLARDGAESIVPIVRSDPPLDDRRFAQQVLDKAQAAMGRKRRRSGFTSARNMGKVGG